MVLTGLSHRQNKNNTNVKECKGDRQEYNSELALHMKGKCRNRQSYELTENFKTGHFGHIEPDWRLYLAATFAAKQEVNKY